MYNRRRIATLVARAESKGLDVGVEDIVFSFVEVLGRVGRRLLEVLSNA